MNYKKAILEIAEERRLAEKIFLELYNNCHSELEAEMSRLCSMVMQTHAYLEDEFGNDTEI